MDKPIATHEDVTTIMALLGDIYDETRRIVGSWRTRVAKKKRKKTTWTAEDEARVQRTARLVQERMAYHSEMSRLLGEREREQRRLEELRRAAR